MSQTDPWRLSPRPRRRANETRIIRHTIRACSVVPSDRPNANAPFHAAGEWPFKEAPESSRGGRALVRVLQFLSHSRNVALFARDGVGRH